MRSILLGLVVIGMGTVGYMVIEKQSPLNAFYMTTITVTTVGFREAFPLSPAGQAFTILLAFGGVGVILLIASEFARAMLDTDIRRMIGIRRDLTMIKKLSSHIAVLGYGRMGQAVVEVLRERGVAFAEIDLDNFVIVIGRTGKHFSICNQVLSNRLSERLVLGPLAAQ